jgi:hypothetical protein
MTTPALSPRDAAEDRALAWTHAATTHRRRAAALTRREVAVRGTGHPGSDQFAAFYAACADDERRVAAFCADVARACLADAEALA